MVRRKRARQEASFYEIRESFRENARLMTMLQHYFSSSSSSSAKEEDAKNVNTSDPRRRSPESVLYESPQVDMLLCREELSPEIVPKVSRIRLDPEDGRENDDVEEAGEAIIATRGIERSESALLEPQQVDLLLCHEQLSPGIALEFSKIDRLNSRTDRENDEAKVRRRNIARKRIERSILNSPGEHEDVASDEVPGVKRERRTLFEGEWKDDSYEAKKTDDCYVLDKTLSMSDDLVREMGNYLDQKSSAATDRCFTVETTPLLDVGVDGLQNKCIMESARLASLHSSDKYDCESSNDVQSSSDKFEPLGSPICGTVDGYEKICQDNADEMRGEKPTNNDKNGDDASENDSIPLVANWREFRKVFTCLQRLNRKIRDEDEPLLSKHRFARDDRRLRYVPITTSPSSSFVSSRAFLSPKKNRKSSALAGRDSARLALADEHRSKFNESSQKTKRSKPNSCRQGSITPCSGSSPSVRRCRATLKFEDEEAKEELRQPAMVRAEVTNDPIPPQRENKSEKHSYPLNLPSCVKMPWNSSSSESTSISSVDLLAVSNYNGSHPRKVEYQNGTCRRRVSQNTATQPDSGGHSSRRRNTSCAVIGRVAALCIWLIKKLLNLLNNGYNKVRRLIASFSSAPDDTSKQRSRIEEFEHVVDTLRCENEAMVSAMSEKVTRLSTEFVQIRTSIEAVLGTLTAEVNSVREVSRNMNENNITLMQELKKMHGTLEEIRSKAAQRISSAASCSPFSSFPPAPPPPSPPPPSLLLRSKHTAESTSEMQPPPPPPPPLPPPPPPLPPTTLPSVFFQSPAPSVPPITPNSCKSNRGNMTPTRKCSTPLLNRPSITVEDLLKVTLKKAPQSVKDNRRNTVPGPRGPVISLDMLRNVKLKSARRRTNDQTGRSPRNGRIMKSRTVSTLSLSPITTGSENNLERILRQVDINRRGPRRLLSGSISFRDHDFTKDDARPQSLEILKHSQSQSAIA